MHNVPWYKNRGNISRFKDIKLSRRKKPQEDGSSDDDCGWRLARFWRTVNFSGYIDCVCTAEPTPADTFWSAAALDTRSQTTWLLRSSAMPTEERGSCIGHGMKTVEGHASTCGETRAFCSRIETFSIRESERKKEKERERKKGKESSLYFRHFSLLKF